MASENSINQPSLDRAFVDAQGRLTQYGYSVLSQLITRVGGSVGEVLNGHDITAAIQDIQLVPVDLTLSARVAEIQARLDTLPRPLNDVTYEAPDDAALTALRAEVDNLRKRVDALEIGYPT